MNRPNLQQALVDDSGKITRPWLDWMDGLQRINTAQSDTSTQAIDARLSEQEVMAWLQPL